MTVYLRLEDEDFRWLFYSVDKNIQKIKNAPDGIYTQEITDTVIRIYESLLSPLKANDAPTDLAKTDVEPLLVVPKKPRARRTTNKDVKSDPGLCKTHPKYSALRMPRSGCTECMAAYEKMNPTRKNLTRAKTSRKKRTN